MVQLVARFFRRHFILWLMHTSLYRWLLKHIIPYIRFSLYYTSLRGTKYHAGYRRLRAGDIILTNDRKKLTGLLIPGEMAHAALCVDLHPAPYEVAEMTHTDFTRSHFFDLCKEADRVVIMRCPDWSDLYRQAVCDQAKKFEGLPYDAGFELGVQALYCSELVYLADKLAAEALGLQPTLKCDLADLAGLGVPYLSPDGLMFTANLVCVWDSDGMFTRLTGAEIEKICCSAST
jgi:hypothetical protein